MAVKHISRCVLGSLQLRMSNFELVRFSPNFLEQKVDTHKHLIALGISAIFNFNNPRKVAYGCPRKYREHKQLQSLQVTGIALGFGQRASRHASILIKLAVNWYPIIMLNKVFINSRSAVEIRVVGYQNENSVREMGERIAACIVRLQKQKLPVLILDDLREMGPTTSEARRMVDHLSRTLQFDRAVMVGDGSGIMKHGTNLMLRAIGKKNLRYFNSLKEAKDWLYR